MKVLQTISGMIDTSGGPSRCTYDLMNALNRIKAPVELMTVSSNNPNEKILGYNQPWLHLVKYDCKPPLMTSKNFETALKNSNYDIYHCNGLWMGINHSTCSIARGKNKKYIISPHGMLYPNALRIHYWKKWTLLKLWYNKDIMSASCIHATCKQEAQYIRDFGYKGPIAIIGNAVEIPQYASIATSKPENLIYIGFLGRLHPIKRVELILYGLSLCSKAIRRHVKLQIMGKGNIDYENFLKKETFRLGLKDNVDFVGFVDGEEKYNRLRKLSVLFVPSESENFGMIIPEALICGTPVFASTGTPWESLNETGCGWWEEATPENIKKTIEYISSAKTNKILEMGNVGRRYIEQNFSDNAIALKTVSLYRWLLTNESIPKFVETL